MHRSIMPFHRDADITGAIGEGQYSNPHLSNVGFFCIQKIRERPDLMRGIQCRSTACHSSSIPKLSGVEDLFEPKCSLPEILHALLDRGTCHSKTSESSQRLENHRFSGSVKKPLGCLFLAGACHSKSSGFLDCSKIRDLLKFAPLTPLHTIGRELQSPCYLRPSCLPTPILLSGVRAARAPGQRGRKAGDTRLTDTRRIENFPAISRRGPCPRTPTDEDSQGAAMKPDRSKVLSRGLGSRPHAVAHLRTFSSHMREPKGSCPILQSRDLLIVIHRLNR
jgi:hypothetical protein